MTQNVGPQNPPVDFLACDQEPIHIPGVIQTHGMLLAVDCGDLTIAHVSVNCLECLQQAPGQLIGRPLDALLTADSVTTLRECLAEATESTSSLRTLTFALKNGEPRAFYASAHRSDDVVIIELERLPVVGTVENEGALILMGKCRIADHRLGRCESVNEFCQVVTRELYSVTHYDRIMVYQFDEEWNGAVIAEEHVEGLEPYLGLHYPASDIPPQARAIFLLNGLRVIPDVRYQPVPLFPTEHPRTGRPLDLSRAQLRSVSPIHLEYLRNMNVGASLTISLVVNGKLWGLVACHHLTPRFVSPALREVCELFGQLISMRLAERLEATQRKVAERSKAVLHRLTDRLTEFGSIIPALLADEIELLSLTDARGAILWREGEALPLGKTPPLESMSTLMQWVATATSDPIFLTNGLPKLFPGAAAYADVASGMLVMALARSPDFYIVWFLPELVQMVDWAGDPDKSIESVGDDGRIHPRRSFARWKKSVRHRSRSWLDGEIEAVKQLQAILLPQLARMAERLRQLLPICAWCKKVRSDQDYWEQVEQYVSQHTDIRFTHGMCPECFDQEIAGLSVDE